MPSTIWKKYKLIKEISSNSGIKTYSARLEPIIKEIIPKDKDDYQAISERLEQLKAQLDIYEIIEEDLKFYIVAENNDELLSQIDKLILSDESIIKKEGIIQGHGSPITIEEINKLFEKDKAMCKISYETLDKKQGKGSGFFCKLDNFHIKYALFTNNHVLGEFNIKIGKKINFEYLAKSLLGYKMSKKQIEITEERRVFTNKELDYTCIELFESDGIYDYFQIDPNLFEYDNTYLINNDIFILQYPNGNDISFSYGKILSAKDNDIQHNASTEGGSSGSPIIIRCKENYVIGLHSGFIKKRQYNIAITFISILDDILNKNKIICIYKPKENDKEINLLHDYNIDTSKWPNQENAKLYLEAKNMNKNIFENYMDIYIDNKKIKFDYKYKIKDTKEIKVKFIFKKILTNTMYMFWGCSSLESIDLSSFNTTNVKDMSYMFYECSSLKSIDLSSFNTTNVKIMWNMFLGCSSLESIDLSSFNTTNVKDMPGMFLG